MKVVIDVEANSLVSPTHIWVIVCKDVDSGELHIFRKVTEDETERKRFTDFAQKVDCWIGHNILEYDGPVLADLLRVRLHNGGDLDDTPVYPQAIDTLIVSRLVDYSRDGGHSIEQYGLEFGYPKIKFNDFKQYSQEMEDYCVRDVEICEKVYRRYRNVLTNPSWVSSLELEHAFQLIVNELHNNGFRFNSVRATRLLEEVSKELEVLDKEILVAFPPREVVIREFVPKLTKHGTISRTSIPRSLHSDIHLYEAGRSYKHTKLVEFNPSSHKQIIAVLNEAGWKPVDKTKTHIDTLREVSRLKRSRDRDEAFDLTLNRAIMKLQSLESVGWKVNENNLTTLPETAPAPARTLARRILLESRRRTLTEWLSLVWLSIKVEKKNIKESMDILTGDKKLEKESTTSSLTDLPSKSIIAWLKREGINATSAEESDHSWLITIMPREKLAGYSVVDVIHALDGLKAKNFQYKIISERIKGKFQGIGAWTHRMAHQKPNTANIPNEFDQQGRKKLLGKEMRSLWCAPRNRLLVGVDAEGIQLRIFAHYIDDKEFTDALVNGRKSDKTDPHSLNQRILGSVCRTRQAAKRFVYALLLGGGIGKLGEILEVSQHEAEAALERLMGRYQGFTYLKESVLPSDGRRGYFVGLDGRHVRLPAETPSGRAHLAMSGYLQNGEALVIKRAAIRFKPLLPRGCFLVNLVHDEYQIEVPNDMSIAIECAKIVADSIRIAGEDLKLKCPLAGSYWNDDLEDYTIATNWAYTH